MCPTGTDLQLDLGADLIIYTVLYVLLRRLITVRGMRIPPGLGLCPCSRGNKNSAKKFCDWPIVRVLSLGPWARPLTRPVENGGLLGTGQSPEGSTQVLLQSCLAFASLHTGCPLSSAINFDPVRGQ